MTDSFYFNGGPYDGRQIGVPQAPEPYTHRDHDGEKTTIHTYIFVEGTYDYDGSTEEADTYTAIDGEGKPEGYVPSS